MENILMYPTQTNDIQILPATKTDFPFVHWLFKEAMNLQGKNGYKVWEEIDTTALEKDVEQQLQYKIVQDKTIACIFSIQYNDPFIWRERDQQDAIYLHRIVVNPNFKGQKQFAKVLQWAIHFAKINNRKFIRMDTWAENHKIIGYYQSYGFVFIEHYKTNNTTGLPLQNRNLDVTLLELAI